MSCVCFRRVMSGEAEGLLWDSVRGLLRVVSVPYGWTASVVEILKQGQGGARVELPVLSIGNITCGGTGKTPFVDFLLRQLAEKGRRPVVLSRGYRAGDDGENDEAKLLRRRHPDVLHLQHKDRVRLARKASDARLGDVIVLDDGFQHQQLHRDLDVCLIDATNPFGYGALLPRGLLREPLGGLYRARPVVLTRTELVDAARIDEIRRQILAHNEHAKIVLSEMRFTGLSDVHGERQGDADGLRDRPVVLASGIGNPEAFERGVRKLGARVLHHEQVEDHHAWTQVELDALARRAAHLSATHVLTTEKDAVKLASLAWPQSGPPLRVLGVEVVLTEGEDVWNGLLAEVLKGR